MQVVKDIIKSRYSAFMWRSGLLDAWLKVRPQRHDVVILNYHNPPQDVFEDHLRSLVRTYNVVSLGRCAAYLRDAADLPPNSIVITFDDAYQRFHDEIFPLLRRFEAQATVFVPTATIDEQKVLWFNKVKALITRPQATKTQRGGATTAASAPSGRRRTREDTCTSRQGSISTEQLPSQCHPRGNGSTREHVDVALSRGDRRRAYREAISILNACPSGERNDCLNDLFRGATFDVKCLAEHAPLTWELIRNMQGHVTFGAHTATHPNLAALDRQQADEEITTSKRRLEEELGAEVRHFAYPFGRTVNIGEQTPDLVRQAGFETAVTTNRGACGKGDDPYMLPRIVCDGIPSGRVLVTRLSNLWVCMST